MQFSFLSGKSTAVELLCRLRNIELLVWESEFLTQLEEDGFDSTVIFFFHFLKSILLFYRNLEYYFNFGNGFSIIFQVDLKDSKN